METTEDFLKKVKKLLSEEKNWIKQHSALNADDKPISFVSDEAVKWCLHGAIEKCTFNSDQYDDAYRAVYDKICRVLWKKYNRCTVSEWNDQITTTHKDVLNLLEEAIAL